ncbi:hypothetical protein F5144DRAFT_207228 [Chaetomium tenue]|uniref:Uncharacterized protein n=1 Tax=Chaetomium tenue TaxID=1854479 RepID=A0ACB7PFS0_9PEZI|nr:hypothetical protein F5144DRAFT_207228 [Chaetomium globosum]
MALKEGLLGRLLSLLLLYPQALLAVETVSEFGADWPHSCVQYCLGRWPSLYDNIGGALQCGRPFYNECYCATAAASASRATSFLASCASTSCEGGDVTLDLSAMQSIYASYCMENGFTQPGATAWYKPAAETGAPAPGSTGETDSAPLTTTRVSVVTQTTASDSGADSSSQSWVTVDATSTVWVNAAGSPVPAPSSNNNQATLKLGLGLGLGLGIPLALAIAGLAIWICIHNNRPPKPNDQPLPPPMAADIEPAGPSPSPLPRKPVAAEAATTNPTPPTLSSTPATATRELEGGRGIHRELGGTGVHPFPDVAPGPPVLVPGQHELYGVGRQPELPGQSGSPPPQYYYQGAGGAGMQGGNERWEMP